MPYTAGGDCAQRNLLLTNIKTSTMHCYRVCTTHHKYFSFFYYFIFLVCNCIVDWPVVLDVAPDTRHNPPRSSLYPDGNSTHDNPIMRLPIVKRDGINPRDLSHPPGRFLSSISTLIFSLLVRLSLCLAVCAIPVRIPQDDSCHEPTTVRSQRLSNPVSRNPGIFYFFF